MITMNDAKSNNRLHLRSLSLEPASNQMGPAGSAPQLTQNWQQLIPPLPNDFNFNNDIMANSARNRHSIPLPVHDYKYHQTNTFHVRHDMPPFLKDQLHNQPQFRSSASIKRDSPGPDPRAPQPPALIQAPGLIQPSGGSPHTTPPTGAGVPALGTPFQLNLGARKKRKQCKKCGLEITGQFVRALNSSFHVDCFCCNECGKQCSSKFFPYEISEGNIKYQVALCEYDYFKKLNLICFNCDKALRGPYITALGNKYHLEHFKCNICNKVFESDESYYEYESNIYCHFHYSKNFANNCEGCDSSIVKQFVELFKGGKNQQWHPECYMVFKFWNITIKKDCIGSLPEGEEEHQLITIENKIEGLVIQIWVVLSTFEELTASLISDMLLNCCIGNQLNGLLCTGKLILFIEILFDAIDKLDNIETKKEPRNLAGKIMSYLAILRKSTANNVNLSGQLSTELLSAITGCAHYLKLLIRLGLQTALRLNQERNDTVAVDRFLEDIKKYEQFQTNDTKVISSALSIPNDSTDLCVHCEKSIEKSCIQLDQQRWHVGCFKCTKCDKLLTPTTASHDQHVFCLHCHESGRKDFVFITDLKQLAYLLKIAFLRSKQVMVLNLKGENKIEAGIRDDYSNTVSDITRLRTKRQEKNLSNSIKKNARKSVIIDAPTGETAPKEEDEIGDNDSFTFEDDRQLFIKKQRSMIIKEESAPTNNLNRTTDLLKSEKSLTLDDIPRIVAAEQARDQRPNAFKHHNSLYQRQKPVEKFQTEVSEPKQIIKYYSELSKQEHFALRHVAVEAISQLLGNKNKIELLSFIQTKKSTNFWDKFKFHSSNSSDKTLGVFGMELEDLTKKYGIESDLGVGPSKLRIPILIEDLINSLKTKDMSVEGIFRLNGNIKKLKLLTDEINNSPLKSPDFTNETAVQLAALMKKWLRELPTPLLTFNLYDLWIETQKYLNDIAMKKRLLKLVYCMLPRSHRNLVEVFLYFFKWVSSFAEIDEETGSKMDVHNLATVLSPNILYSKTNEASQSDSYFLAIEVINDLIELNEELCYISPDLLEFYDKVKSDKDLSTKEIMNKIDKVSKEIPTFFKDYRIKEDELITQGVKTNRVTRGLSKVSVEYKGEPDNMDETRMSRE